MPDRAMLFELVIRRFFGKKAYHKASSENFDQSRNLWLRKSAKKIQTEIDAIDTHNDHKQQLFLFADRFRAALGTKNPDQRELIYLLLGLVATLLGFCSVRGTKLTSPFYSRTADEYYASLLLKGDDEALQDYYNKNNVIALRRQIVADLKTKNIDDFHIAMALNMTENAVKKLKR